jgi:hypothetical protein
MLLLAVCCKLLFTVKWEEVTIYKCFTPGWTKIHSRKAMYIYNISGHQIPPIPQAKRIVIALAQFDYFQLGLVS